MFHNKWRFYIQKRNALSNNLHKDTNPELTGC